MISVSCTTGRGKASQAPEDVDVAVGAGVRREDVVVRDDNHLLWVPDLHSAGDATTHYSSRKTVDTHLGNRRAAE